MHESIIIFFSTRRFKELDAKRDSTNSNISGGNNFKIPDVPKPSQDVDSIEDWSAELRPSMRKLRQGIYNFQPTHFSRNDD